MSARVWLLGDYGVRVVAPHFVAGLEIEGDRCIFAAPILRWAVGKPVGELRGYFRSKGWRASIIKGSAP